MPSSPNYKRNYQQEYATESTQRRQFRAERNRARRLITKTDGLRAVKGQDVGHKQALSRGGITSLRNLEIQTPADNRSFQRNPDGSMKSERSLKERKKK